MTAATPSQPARIPEGDQPPRSTHATKVGIGAPGGYVDGFNLPPERHPKLTLGDVEALPLPEERQRPLARPAHNLAPSKFVKAHGRCKTPKLDSLSGQCAAGSSSMRAGRAARWSRDLGGACAARRHYRFGREKGFITRRKSVGGPAAAPTTQYPGDLDELPRALGPCCPSMAGRRLP